jgi:Fur family peroxide stress response transcriptional regulator
MMTIPENAERDIARVLREQGYKATPQRITISKYALNTDQHPTADRIYRETLKTHPTVSLATVYTTLKILKEIGLVQELNMPQQQNRFDPNLSPHAHLICLQCGEVSDWMDPLIPELVDRISSDTGSMVSGSSLNVNIVCRKCQFNVKTEAK